MTAWDLFCEKSKKAGLLGLAVPFFFLAACGDDSSSSDNPVALDDIYPTVEDLPECTEDLQGDSLLVGDDEDTYVCSEGEWEKVVEPEEKPKPGDPEKKKPEEKKPEEKKPDDKKPEEKPVEKDTLVTDTLAKDTVVTDTAGKVPEVKLAVENGTVSGFLGAAMFDGAVSVSVAEVNEKFEAMDSAFAGTVDGGKFKVEKINLENPYAMVQADGFIINLFYGGKLAEKQSLSVVTNASEKNEVDVNVLTHLASARTVAVLGGTKGKDAAEFNKTFEKSVDEVLKTFNMDNKDSEAAAFAILLILQAASEGELNKMLDDVAQDIAKDGSWDDNSSVRLGLADWALTEDIENGFAVFRENAGFPKNGSVDFVKYMREFYETELKFDKCDAENADATFFVKDESSGFYAKDFEDITNSRVRFACDAKKGWVVISDSLKDTKYGPEGKDGDVRQGVFTGLYYVYDKGTWKEASAVERDAYFVQQSAVDSFIDIQKVYDDIKDDEKVIFILRHAERTDDTSLKGLLTDNGKKQSEDVGKKLVKFADEFVLGASQFVRAQQTVTSIAIGRGQIITSVRDTFPELNDDWYSKDKDLVDKAKNECGGGWEVTSKYAYTGAYSTGANAAYYDLAERSVELIEDVLLKKYDNPSERFVMLSSHDKLMVPLVAYCTGKKLELKKYDGGKWINYLAGVAVIVDKSGARRYVPVKGLESGYMN